MEKSKTKDEKEIEDEFGDTNKGNRILKNAEENKQKRN